jgi:hypothetical protein
LPSRNPKSLETTTNKAHTQPMDSTPLDRSADWADELARSDDELARGERVPASVIHEDLRRALAELDPEHVPAAAATPKLSRQR